MDPPKDLPFNQREQIAQKIDALINSPQNTKNENAISSFVAERVKNLEQTSPSKKITALSNSINGFINSKSEIKPTIFVDGFMLDDTEIYKALIQEIIDIKHAHGQEQKTVRDIALNAVLRTIDKYFGNFISDNTTSRRRKIFYEDHSNADSEAFSVRELKGQCVAECMEKAATAQNLLTFLGYNSKLILSNKCELTPGNSELHAYNILSTDRGNFIVDFTNPLLVEDQERNIVNILPNAYPISNEQLSTIMQGGRITVDHSNVTLHNNQFTKQPPVKRIYGGPINHFL